MTAMLNDDVMLEILQWFVSIDDLGPYTLFHVSNAWRATLLQTPSLWTWITIDALYDDLEERVQLSVRMSGSLSLRFRIKLRGGNLPKARWLRPHLIRADLLILELPDSTRKLISHEKIFLRIRSFLTGVEWSPVLRVVWMRNGEVEGVKPNSITKEKAKLNPRRLSSTSMTLRNLLATQASITSPHWEGDASTITLLSTMRNLSELRLWDYPVNVQQIGPHDQNRSPIHLPPLRTFELGILKRETAKYDPESLHNLRFAAYLKVHVEHLSILDYLDGIVSTISRIGAYIQPDILTLYPLDVQYTSSLKLHSPLNKLFRLNIDLAESNRAISEEGFPVMAKALHSLLLSVPTISICRLILTPSTLSYAFHFLSLHQSPLRDIRFEVTIYETDKAVTVIPLATQPLGVAISTIVDLYELRPKNLFYSGRFSVRHLMIKTRWGCQKVSTTLTSLLATPDGNYSHLQHLDTGRVDFEPEDGGDQLARLPSLTVLRCVPEVAVRLLRASSVPALEELTLVDNIYGGDGDTPNHRLVTEMFELLSAGHYRHLQALRFQFYPHWPDLLELLKNLISRESQVEYHLALPSYPSRLILTLLVDVLMGETKNYPINDPTLLEEPWSFNEFKNVRWSGKRGQCYYCFCSHQKVCKGGSTVACMRHSKDAPVEITKYSLT